MKTKTIRCLFVSLIFLIAINSGVIAEIVNINKADAGALKYYLKGIGEKKSVAIVKYRETNGDFKAIVEIKNVKGIGDKIFEKIQHDLAINKGATTTPDKLVKTKTKEKKSEPAKKDEKK